jgi:predicted kinase
MIILMAGLPGTGKTTLGRALADHFSGAVLSKDEIRAAVFSPPDIEYSTEQDDLVQQMMQEAAESLLRKNPERFVFLDGRTFSRRYQIDRVIELADRLNQQWRIVECTCSEETAEQRLTDERHPAKDRDFQLYRRVKARFEPITLPKIVIDSDQPAEACLASAVRFLSS